MKKLAKAASLLMILALSLGLLAGCGDTEGNDSVYSQGLNDDGYFNFKALDYITLGDYSHMVVNRDDLELTKQYILEDYPSETEVMDRAAENLDTVVINYVGYMDGVPFDGGTATNQEVTIGVSSYIDGFLDQIIGHTPGETFTIDVTFPDPYPNNPDFSGKPAQFDITLEKIIERTYESEITDAFVEANFKDDYGWTTAAELEQNLAVSYAVGNLQKESPISEVPESLVDYFVECFIQDQTRSAEMSGLTLAEMLETYNMTADELREQYREYAYEDAEEALLYQAIAEDQGIKVSRKDITEFFKGLTGSSYYTEYRKQYGMPYLKSSVLRSKVEKLLQDNIAIE